MIINIITINLPYLVHQPLVCSEKSCKDFAIVPWLFKQSHLSVVRTGKFGIHYPRSTKTCHLTLYLLHCNLRMSQNIEKSLSPSILHYIWIQWWQRNNFSDPKHGMTPLTRSNDKEPENQHCIIVEQIFSANTWR